MNLIIAEKPSLGRSIASALGCTQNKGKYMTNPNGSIVVTWQFGHLFGLYDVNDYEFGLKSDEKIKWQNIPLPYVPKFEFKLKSDQGVRDQYKEITNLVKKADVVINAGDPDREGQILVDITLKQLGYDITKAKRLWLPEITDVEIKKAYNNLLSNKDCMNIHNEGIARMYMDWLLGINATVYTSVKANNTIQIGRVLVPIVKYIYDRDMEIKNFVPKDYFQNESESTVKLVCSEKFDKREDATKQAQELNSHKIARVVDIQDKEIKKQPPKLFSLSKLQAKITKSMGMSPQKSMPIIQGLYEKGLITYPRTSTEYLGENEKDKFKDIVNAHNKDLGGLLTFKDKKSIFDSSKVESHSAITPTIKTNVSGLSDAELKVYQIVKNRFFANFCKEDCIVNQTTMEIKVGDYPFKLKGEVVVQEGFLKFEKDNITNNLPKLKVGDTFDIHFESIAKQTTPPSKVTYDQLINFLNKPLKKDDVDTLSSEDDSEDYKDILAGLTIGTEATRTQIIKNAIDYKYIDESTKKNSISYSITDRGIYLIETLDKLGINMYKEKSVEMSRMLNDVYKNNLRVEDMVHMVKDEIQTFVDKNVEIEKLDRNVGNKAFVEDTIFGDVYKKTGTKVGTIYSNGNKENPFVLMQECYVYGTKVKLSDAQAKKLLQGKAVEMELYSKSKNKNYTALVSISGKNDKGFPEFSMTFPQVKKKTDDKVK